MLNGLADRQQNWKLIGTMKTATLNVTKLYMRNILPASQLNQKPAKYIKFLSFYITFTLNCETEAKIMCL